MRHKKSGRKLNRTTSHRKALLRNLANQLIEHKEIRTTTAKAKEARSTVERLITYAKKGSLHHRRLAFGFLRKKDSIKILFDEIAPVYSEREGGYTRVLKLGRRAGDGAHISLLQLVGFEKLGEISKPEKKVKTRKKDDAERAGERKADAVTTAESPAQEEVKEETPADSPKSVEEAEIPEEKQQDEGEPDSVPDDAAQQDEKDTAPPEKKAEPAPENVSEDEEKNKKSEAAPEEAEPEGEEDQSPDQEKEKK